MKSLKVEEGNTVKKGDLVATIDEEPILNKLNQVKAQLKIAKQFVKDLQDKIDSVDSLESDITTSQKQMDESSSNTQSMYTELKSKREVFNLPSLCSYRYMNKLSNGI